MSPLLSLYYPFIILFPFILSLPFAPVECSEGTEFGRLDNGFADRRRGMPRRRPRSYAPLGGAS